MLFPRPYPIRNGLYVLRIYDDDDSSGMFSQSEVFRLEFSGSFLPPDVIVVTDGDGDDDSDNGTQFTSQLIFSSIIIFLLLLLIALVTKSFCCSKSKHNTIMNEEKVQEDVPAPKHARTPRIHLPNQEIHQVFADEDYHQGVADEKYHKVVADEENQPLVGVVAVPTAHPLGGALPPIRLPMHSRIPAERGSGSGRGLEIPL